VSKRVQAVVLALALSFSLSCAARFGDKMDFAVGQDARAGCWQEMVDGEEKTLCIAEGSSISLNLAEVLTGAVGVVAKFFHVGGDG